MLESPLIKTASLSSPEVVMDPEFVIMLELPLVEMARVSNPEEVMDPEFVIINVSSPSSCGVLGPCVVVTPVLITVVSANAAREIAT